MRKEVLLAIIVGIALGAVILFGINLANKSVSSSTSTGQTKNSGANPTPTVANKSLTIVSPLNHSVTTEKMILLTGRAHPGANLAIISELDDLLIEASPEGTFSAQINLEAGENIITISEVQKDLTLISESISVIQTASLPE